MERKNIDCMEREVRRAGLRKFHLFTAEMENGHLKKSHITLISEKPSELDVKGASSWLREMNGTTGRSLLANTNFPPKDDSLALA
jgi:hypothetical protein